MYAQLGNIVFSGLFGFESYSSTDNTTYAQHDLIGIKPILQPTGNDLEELAITVHLNAGFIKPEEAYLELKKAKDNFEVLPLLKGSGQFIGSFVLTSIQKTENTALNDGAVTDMTLALTLKEYAAPDRLRQQQSAARKLAFACGDIKPTTQPRIPAETVTQQCSTDVAAVQARADVVEQKAAAWQDNTTARPSLESSILTNVQAVTDRLTQLQQRIAQLPDPQTAMDNAIDIIRDRIGEIAFPIVDGAQLQQRVAAFQTAIEGLRTAAAGIVNQVITRAA